MEHRHDFIAKFLVSAKVTANEEEIAAELTGPPTRHARPDSEAPGLIGRRQHDATVFSLKTTFGFFPQSALAEQVAHLKLANTRWAGGGGKTPLLLQAHYSAGGRQKCCRLRSKR